MNFDLKAYIEDQLRVQITKVSYDRQHSQLTLRIESKTLIATSDQSFFVDGIIKALPFVRAVHIDWDYGNSNFSAIEMVCYIASKSEKLKQFSYLQQSDSWKSEGVDRLMLKDVTPSLYYQLSAIDAGSLLAYGVRKQFQQELKVLIEAPGMLEEIDEAALNSRLQDMIDLSKPSAASGNQAKTLPNGSGTSNKNGPRNQSFGDGSGFKKSSKDKDDPRVLYKRVIKSDPSPLNGVLEEESFISVIGEVFAIDTRVLSTGKTMLTFAISDHTNAIKCKLFLDKEEVATVPSQIKANQFYWVEGRLRYDTYEKDTILMVMAINVADQPVQRKDLSERKRIELHAHTAMSAMDALPSAKN